MVEVAKNFTIAKPDSTGRFLVGDDHVTHVSYYNTTEESWTRDYADAPDNPFSNHDFSGATVTGTVWYQTGPDASASASDKFFKVAKIPYLWEEDLFSQHAVILEASPVSGPYDEHHAVGDYFLNADDFVDAPPRNVFPENYIRQPFDRAWTTSSGTPATGHGYLTYQFQGGTQEFVGIYIDVFDQFTANGVGGTGAIAAEIAIGEYILEAAASGTGLLDSPDFFVLASGTNQQLDPLWFDFSPTIAEFVRLRFRNQGNSTRTSLVKFYAFSQETVDEGFCAFIFNGYTHWVDSSRTLGFNQDVNLGGVDRLYLDFKDSGGVNLPQLATISVGGSTAVSYPQQNPLISINHITFVQFSGLSIDTSAYGLANFRVDINGRSNNRHHFALRKITNIPPWFDEDSSAERGERAAFPDEALFVIDSKGMSIVDVTEQPGNNEIDPKLWMRFDLSWRKMLQQLPREVAAREGRVYMATSRGLFVLDFTDNVCVRFDELGPYRRYGIDARNTNHFDLGAFSTNADHPSRVLLTYTRFTDTPVIPELDLYSVAVGTDSGFGDFVVIGSARGLLIFNDELDGSALFYQSKNRQPVHHVRVANNTVWYIQGEGAAATLNRIDDVGTAAAADFIPDEIYHTEATLQDSLAGPIDLDKWRILSEDPGMVLDTGEYLTISGSHDRGGATGLVSRNFYADRDFTAKVKVSLREFPPEARGAVRFGFCYDYADAGLRSLRHNFGRSARNGCFISALNVDPFGGHLFESAPFQSGVWEDQRGWSYMRAEPSSGSIDSLNYIQPQDNGVFFRTLHARLVSGDNLLIRVVSSWIMLLRSFTARIDAQLVSGFVEDGPNENENPGAWFGVGNRFNMFGGTNSTGDHVNAAMLVRNYPTFSGIPVYTVGRHNSSATLEDAVFDHNLVVPTEATENSGLSSPFREWRIDYDYPSATLTAYVDDERINSIKLDHYTQPPLMGLSFGLWGGRGEISLGQREVYFRNLRVAYPPLNPASQNKYALEWVENSTGVDNGVGGIRVNLTPFTTFSGLSLAGDDSPSSSTLTSAATLSDGQLHTGGVSMVQETSVGTALSGTFTVEALHVYDTSPTTDGWNSGSVKRVELWSSDDNAVWSYLDTYDLNFIERLSGRSKFVIEPAVTTQYLKLRVVDPGGNYLVPGGGAWGVSEIQPLTVSGSSFYGDDGTPSADFREWKLEYVAATRGIKGYIDDVLVSTGALPEPVEQGQFVLVHDLAPVASGSHSNFWGQFKELEVELPGGTILPPGEVDAFSVNSNSSGPSSANYTIMVATVSGVYISDIDLGPGASLPTTTKVFADDADLFGDSRRASALFADSSSQRDDGLVFAGTSSFHPPVYSHRFNKPFWIERDGDSSGGDETWFGGSVALGYHPGLKNAVVNLGRSAAYTSVLSFEEERWKQVSRADHVVEFEEDINFLYSTEALKVVYSVYDDNMWFVAEPIMLGSFNVYSGDHFRADIDDSATVNNNGMYHLAYVLHDHTLIYGGNYLERWDVAGNQDHVHPRHFTGLGPQRWNRLRTQVPWPDLLGFGGAGSANAAYCDYDKCVYFLAAARNQIDHESFFYRYHPDKDYLELITGGTEISQPWPASDSELESFTPVPSYLVQGQWLIYVPTLRRMYVISSRGTVPQFYYYDVVNQRWEYPGQNPPYVAIRDFPSGSVSADLGTSHAVYDIERRSIVMYGRAGKDATLLEYRLERDDFEKGFEYIPSRDGLPATTSGSVRQFTRNSSMVQQNYTPGDGSFTRDFYDSRSVNAATAPSMLSTSVEADHITLSGVPSNTDFGLERYLWVSSDKIEANISFDLRAKVAMPSWSNKFPTDTGADWNELFFVMGMQDGLNRDFGSLFEVGTPDPDLYQVVELRAGVSGSTGQPTTDHPFVGHLRYSDAQINETFDAVVNTTFDTYGNGGLDFGVGGFSEFKDFRLSYDYDTDIVEGFIEGVSVGSTTLKRKFDENGLRFALGYYISSNGTLSDDRHYVTQIKDIEINPKAWERIEDSRLITSVSGSVGSYYHEKWDMTLVSGTDWVYETDVYLPTHRRFGGYDYIGSLAGIGDGHKLIELIAFVGAGQKKRVGITGGLNDRYDRSTYLGVVDHQWDDIDLGNYKIVRDATAQTVAVFIDGEEEPSITVDYDALPNYKFQHVYHGKVDYGDFERVWGPTTLSGSWSTQPNFTNQVFDPAVEKVRWKNDPAFARFATVTQVLPLAEATYSLDSDLGEVDLYTFYVASGYDLAKNTPYTVTSSGVVGVPSAVGDGNVIHAIETNTDQFGSFDPNATTIRVDQRRTFTGEATTVNAEQFQSSGWVYLGRYINPSKVVVSADAQAGTDSSGAFVCAGAVGTKIGQRGRSTLDISVAKVHYLVGQKEFNPDPIEPSGVSVLDLEDQQLIDFYGKQTAPAIPGASITSGDKFED